MSIGNLFLLLNIMYRTRSQAVGLHLQIMENHALLVRHLWNNFFHVDWNIQRQQY